MSRYEIVIVGEPSVLVVAALDGFVQWPTRPGEVRLVGQLRDQAALTGVLQRLSDLRVEILSVRRLDWP